MTKITEAEIKKVTDLKIQYNQLIETIGSIEVQKMQLELQKEELKVSLLNIKKKKSQ
tara:strand:+ start:291 stop:461 length:171 start_codon:yes stop_codon:yes gene_type:complete